MRDVVKRTKLTENCSKETIKKYVDEVIQELTLDEKIGVMSGQVTEKKLLDDLFLIEHYNVKPYPTKAVERLGIPNIRFVDGPRGVVAGSATCFPVSMARGASFDRDLEEKIGEVGDCINGEIVLTPLFKFVENSQDKHGKVIGTLVRQNNVFNRTEKLKAAGFSEW